MISNSVRLSAFQDSLSSVISVQIFAELHLSLQNALLSLTKMNLPPVPRNWVIYFLDSFFLHSLHGKSGNQQQIATVTGQVAFMKYLLHNHHYVTLNFSYSQNLLCIAFHLVLCQSSMTPFCPSLFMFKNSSSGNSNILLFILVY